MAFHDSSQASLSIITSLQCRSAMAFEFGSIKQQHSTKMTSGTQVALPCQGIQCSCYATHPQGSPVRDGSRLVLLPSAQSTWQLSMSELNRLIGLCCRVYDSRQQEQTSIHRRRRQGILGAHSALSCSGCSLTSS